MKKQLLLALVALLSLPLSAQKQTKTYPLNNTESTLERYAKKDGATIALTDSLVKYRYNDQTLIDSSRVLKTSYKYDDNNNNITLHEELKWSTSDKKWIVTNIEIFKYDANNNLTLKEVYESSEYVARIGLEKFENTYDYNNKLTLHEEFKWDGVNGVWLKKYKKEHNINIEENSSIAISYHWDDRDNNWDIGEKVVERYDKNNNTILYEDYFWEPASKTYIGINKRVLEFDNNKNKILEEKYSWSSSNSEWNNSTKETYSYNSHNEITSKDMYEWDTNNSTWLIYGKSKTTYKYNSNDKLTLVNEYGWDFNKSIWIGTRKTTIEYNSEGHQSFYESSYWNSSKSTWILSYRSKVDYEYDYRKNIILKDFYQWDDSLGWLISRRTVQAYDIKNNLILIERYQRDRNSGDIIGISKIVGAYDSNNYLVLTEYYSWNRANNIWRGNDKKEFSVTESGSPYFAIVSYGDTNGNWNTYGSDTYYFHEAELSNETLDVDSYKIFPNPLKANNSLTVQSKGDNEFSYKIFSPNGLLILNGTSKTKQKSIDVSSLSKGVYIIKITNSEGNLSKRFIR